MFTRGRLLLVLAILAFSGAAAIAQETGAAASTAPSPRMLDGLTPEAVMELANGWGMKNDENNVNIWTTSREFHFEFPDGTRTVIAMPDDRMVVSVAPYMMKTHPCREHFPSSCRGELANTPVKVKAVTKDGKVVLEENTTTLPNGFVDLWLPRNLQIDVTLAARGLTATQRIGTSDSDKTCVTEPKLHY